MAVKKTAEEIKGKILQELDSKAMTVADIAEKISSNWITTEKFLRELQEEKKVKELVSTENKKIYQLITGDTYFNLPINDEQRKKFRTLFYLIMKTYKEKNKIPTKTQLSKCAVKVIDDPRSGLSNLPTISYLYGKIPVMVANPSEKYAEEEQLENRTRIIYIIREHRNKYCDQTTKTIDRDQHKESGDELYNLSDDFLIEINKEEPKQEELLRILNHFFIECPVDEDFPEVFEFTDKFVSTLNKLSRFDNLSNYKKEIISTFNALWKYIATYKAYNSIKSQKLLESKELILKFYIGNMLNVRKTCFEESFSELNSIYLSKLSEASIDNAQLSKEAQEAREILEGWTGED